MCGVELGCHRLGEEYSVLGLSRMDIFCTAKEVNRNCSFGSAHLQQQKIWFWLTSHKSLNSFLHLFPQHAKRKSNKYLLLHSLDAGFIPLAILSLLLWQLIMWLWCVLNMGEN